jgi:hypothetical protein
MHFTFPTISAHLKQIEHFTEITARSLAREKRSVSLLKIWLSPKWRFFNDYILHGGFLDGYEGYMIGKLSALATQIKYSKVRQYVRNKQAENAAGL